MNLSQTGSTFESRSAFSQEVFQLIFMQAGEGIFLADPQGVCIEVNPRGCEMLGYSRAELLGLPLKNLIPDERLAFVRNEMRALNQGDYLVSETVLLHKNGAPITVEASIKVLSNGHVLGKVREISERRLAEQSMSELASQWRATFDATSDAILLLNREQRILRSNRAMQTLFGLGDEALKGKFCWEVVHGTSEPPPNCPVRNMFKSLQRESMELHRNGRWLEITVDPVFNENGVPLAAIHVIRDMTERRKIEEALRQSQNKFSILFGKAALPVVLSRYPEHVIVDVNEAWTELFGYTREETIGRTSGEVGVSRDAGERNHLIERLHQQGQVRALERVLYSKSGRTLIVLANINVIQIDGEEYAITTMQDITARKRAQDQVRASEEKYRQLFELGADAFLLIEDETGRIQDVNQVVVDLYGYSREELLHFRYVDLSAESEEECRNILTGMTNLPICLHRKKDGTIFPVEVTTSRFIYKNKAVRLSAVRDISERVNAEQALIASEEKFRSLVEQSVEGIIIVDEDGDIVEWNHGQEKLSGLKREDVLGRPIWVVQHEMIPEEMQPEGFLEIVRQSTHEVLRTGYGIGLNVPRETAIQLPNGERRFIEVVMYTYKTDRGYRVGSISRDITERKQAELRLEYLAMHDGLTGLPNRQLFHDRLTQALERARREKQGMLAVMLLDLDNFKEVNDTFGHAYGDQLLKIVAQRLHGSLRKSDTAARMGGDEFTLISEEVDSLESCTMIAKKVLSTLSELMKIGDKPFHVTASLGISLYPFDGTDAATLLRHADIAMYRAKGTGNAYQFYRLPE